MENIPNLPYDSSEHLLSFREPKLIPIDNTSDENLDISDHNLYHDDGDFVNKIERLKQQNTQKFKTKWEHILDKYSNIDDQTESDEIDLNTGKITIDNGHLKSLDHDPKHANPTHLHNIWSADYDGERELRVREKKLKEKKLQQKIRLKQMQMFHNLSSDSVDELPPKRPSSTSLEDNLLLNPSPTKRSKLSYSPVRGDSIFDDSPTKGSVPYETEDDSPVKKARALKTVGRTAIKLDFKPLTVHETAADRREDKLDKLDKSLKNYANDDSMFEEEYLIISDYFDTSENAILHCAFDKCFYCTGNKALYQNHLLENHIDALYSLGYPVSAGETVRVSESSAQLLNEQFPLKYPVPPLALSRDGLPFYCKEGTGTRHCQRFFLSAGDLKKHQESGDLCSYKKQVLVCPLLGCGYMTDGGYMEWREHFITEGHDLDPKNVGIIKKDTGPGSDRYYITRRNESVNDNIDELFSDDSGIESDLQDSGSEEENDVTDARTGLKLEVKHLKTEHGTQSVSGALVLTAGRAVSNKRIDGDSAHVQAVPENPASITSISVPSTRQVSVKGIPNLWQPVKYDMDWIPPSLHIDEGLEEFFNS